MGQNRIVGLQFKPDLYAPSSCGLERHGWGGRPKDSHLLWNDAPDLPERLGPRRYDQVLDVLRKGRSTSSEIAAATGIEVYGYQFQRFVVYPSVSRWVHLSWVDCP